MNGINRPVAVILLTSLSVVALLLVYMFLGFGSQNPRPTLYDKLPAVTCSFAVTSFCATQASMKQYVATNDFSDVLENQVPTSIVCNGRTPLEQYCQSGANGITIQLFQVLEGKTMTMLTRNRYITYFMAYAQAYGPLNYLSTDTVGKNILMSFENSSGTHGYTLLFTQQGSIWKVSYPTVSTATT